MGVQVEKVERGFGQRAKRTEESGRESAGTLDHGVEGARVGLYTRKASNFTFVSTGRDYRGETEVREEGDRITVSLGAAIKKRDRRRQMERVGPQDESYAR